MKKKIERMQEKLRDAGVEVISSEEYLVHTSGHGCKEDIRRMFEMVKPKIVIPVHGDKRAIRQQKRYTEELDCGVKQVLVIRDGDVVNIKDSHAEIIGRSPDG